MRLNNLSIKDKKIISEYLGLRRRELSVYAFENIYIWKSLFDIKWAIVEDSLCVFFKDKIGCFLYLPPLGENKNPGVLRKIFAVMDKYNKNQCVSRIENIEAQDIDFFQGSGLVCQGKSYDYLCKREDLANLGGSQFKSKRACVNYFIGHNEFGYLPFCADYRGQCLGLYNLWMRQRKNKFADPIYQAMLGDSLSCVKVLLQNFKGLDVIGRVMLIKKKVKAFTFGFRLNPDTFCILYEITDLSIKGLAQFIFRQFCQELKDYKYINIMDDTGLENLKKVKLSYRPIRFIPAYIAKRKTRDVSLPGSPGGRQGLA